MDGFFSTIGKIFNGITTGIGMMVLLLILFFGCSIGGCIGSAVQQIAYPDAWWSFICAPIGALIGAVVVLAQMASNNKSPDEETNQVDELKNHINSIGADVSGRFASSSGAKQAAFNEITSGKSTAVRDIIAKIINGSYISDNEILYIIRHPAILRELLQALDELENS